MSQENHLLLLQEMESMSWAVTQVLQMRMALSPPQLMMISQIYPFFYCSSEASSNTLWKNPFHSLRLWQDKRNQILFCFVWVWGKDESWLLQGGFTRDNTLICELKVLFGCSLQAELFPFRWNHWRNSAWIKSWCETPLNCFFFLDWDLTGSFTKADLFHCPQEFKSRPKCCLTCGGFVSFGFLWCFFVVGFLPPLPFLPAASHTACQCFARSKTKERKNKLDFSSAQ